MIFVIDCVEENVDHKWAAKINELGAQIFWSKSCLVKFYGIVGFPWVLFASWLWHHSIYKLPSGYLT